MLDVGRPHAGPIKFRFNKTQLGLKRPLRRWPHADRHSRTTTVWRAERKAEIERHCSHEECFSGDGAVVSYLNNVRRPKETTMKLCREAVDDAADRGWTRKFVQEPPDRKDVAAPDDLSIVLGFTQMLSGGNEDEASDLATDHGWLDAGGQLTAAGDQLARALLQQNGTRTIFRVW
jgi:hypothetical protein